MIEEFDYQKTLKTRSEKEYVNLQMYLLVSSRTITRLLYYTPVTPHHVILFSLILGVTASVLFVKDSMPLVVIGAVMLFYKNVFDKVDGSLARAKGLATRKGRFYDSLSDFIVSVCLFAAVGYSLATAYNNSFMYLVSFAALISSLLQCSFFVYYDVTYVKFSGKNSINRLTEEITAEDLVNEDRFTLFLQRIFQLIYGWQDKIFYCLDMKCYNSLRVQFVKNETQESRLSLLWYYHKKFLTLSSSLGIGTHMVLIALFAIIGRFDYYIVLNLILMNLLLIFAFTYHYVSVKFKMKSIE